MAKFRRTIARAKNCPLCTADAVVDYKDGVLLRRYVSERGKILGRVKTGVCASHQRQITRVIKLARFVGLLPYVVG